MIYVIEVFLFALLTAWTRAQCAVGCLRCVNSTCVACDFVNSYQLANSTCSLVSLPNCAVANLLSGCLVCQSGYYLDPSSGGCVAVPSNNIIQNCQAYQSAIQCAACASNYFLVNTTCSAVPVVIAQCVQYGVNGTTCTQCSASYQPSADGFRCVPFANFPSNCLIKRNFECAQCSAGFIANPAQYIDTFRSVSTSFVQIFYSMTARTSVVATSTFTPFVQPFCQRGSVANCQLLNGTNSCAQCPPGTYFNASASACAANPIQPIRNCQTYFTLQQCSRCVQGFYRFALNNCSAVVPISGCQTYDPSASTTICTACVAGQYLSSNTCVNRTNSLNIAQCLNTTANVDTCAVCNSGFALTTDGLKCLAIVANCLSYSPSSTSSTALTCTQCVNGFYLSNSACVAGTVSNCLTYQVSTANACSVCANGYFLSGGNCVVQATVPNCQNYSSSVSGSCVTCNPGNILFTQTAACKLITTSIPNCQTYSSATVCGMCADGYYLNAAACVQITPSLNCLQFSNGACTKCAANFLLRGGLCRSFPTAEQSLCASSSSSGTSSSYTCLSCVPGATPFNFNNLAVCRLQSELVNTLIANCLVHSPDTGAFTCLRCAAGFFIASDGASCVTSCPGTVALLQLSFASMGTNIAVSGAVPLKCASSNTNCLWNVPSTTTVSSSVCVRCKTGTIPTRPLNNLGGLFSPLMTAASFQPLLSAEYFDLDCLTPPASPTYYPGGATPDPNCETWYADGANLMCGECAWGKTGAASVVNIGGNIRPYVSCSTSVAGCTSTARYSGLTFNSFNPYQFGTDPSFMASCHACSGGAIPFLFFDPNNMNSVTRPFALTLSANVPNQASSPSDSVVQCLNPTAAALTVAPQNFLASGFVPNCGLAAMDTSQNKLFSAQGSSIYCLACAPGFRRVLDIQSGAILKCSAIPLCSATNSTIFNMCAVCQAGAAWLFNETTTTPQLDVCWPTPDPNCAVVSLVDLRTLSGFTTHPSANCFACQPGFSFNQDGICTAIAAPFCAAAAFSTLSSMVVSGDLLTAAYPIFFPTYLLSRSGGCAACQTNYAAVQINSNSFICLTDSSSTASIYSLQSKYILNCANYAVRQTDLRLVCGGCAPGFFASADGLQCVSAAFFPNCSVYAGGACTACANGFYLSFGACIAGTTANCLTYNSNANCVTCAQGYYLSGDTCLLGAIVGCTAYSAAGVCSVCTAGYSLISIAGGNTYCLPIPATLNCATYNSIISSNQLSCTQCAPGYAVTTTISDFTASACLPLVPINGCATFDVQASLASSSLACTACQSAFFLSAGACVQRRQLIQNCTIFEPAFDACNTCAAGFFLSTDKLACVPNPSGIFGCENYTSAAVCASCMPGFYLNGTACAQVTAPISGCRYYASATACSTCQQNFMLTGPVNCTRALATNCMSFVNLTTCLACGPGYGLQFDTSSNTTNCVPLSLSNCLNATATNPPQCLLCANNFYPFNGGCAGVSLYIPGCIAYSGPMQCSRCLTGLVLSVTGLACLSPATLGFTLDPGCDATFLSNAPSCSICNPGFYPAPNGTCAQCSTGTSNCLTCDYLNPVNCLTCNPGYDMVRDGVCTPRSTSTITVTVYQTVLSALAALALLLLY